MSYVLNQFIKWIVFLSQLLNYLLRSIGGGDSLYGKIYDGISRAKVVLWYLSKSNDNQILIYGIFSIKLFNSALRGIADV